MTNPAELERLLSQVHYDENRNSTAGLDPLRHLLDGAEAAQTIKFLHRKLPSLEGRRAGSIAFILAAYHHHAKELQPIEKLFANDDANVKASVLSALSGNPGTDLALGQGVIRMALQGLQHPDTSVRKQACWVIQNQCAWGMDVTHAMEPLQSLLNDDSDQVRDSAAYAIGNLAQCKYAMSACIPGLRRNARHENIYVRRSSAWALWHLSRSKHNIDDAVPELVQLLADKDEYDELANQAGGALLHHARKSSANLLQLKLELKKVRLSSKRKEIKRFQDQLAKLK